MAPAIADLVDRGLVRILDLVFVKKDADGTITAFEYDEIDEGSVFAEIDGDADGMLSEQDLGALAADIPADSSALFILWEDLWAAELGDAVRSAGGELVAGGRIPHRVVEQIVGDVNVESEGAPA